MELTHHFDAAAPVALGVRLTSATLVLVADRGCPDSALVESFVERLHGLFVDVEIVVVASGVSPEVGRDLKLLVEHVPDCLVVFLAEPAHEDVARLVGIDHAVGDHVVFATPTAAEERSIAALVEKVGNGFDLVTAAPSTCERRGLYERLLVNGFGVFMRLASRTQFELRPATLRVMSRAAALYLVSRREGELMIRARSLGAAFPSAEVKVDAADPQPSRPRSLRRDLARGVRLMTTGSASLLRASSYLALFGGSASAVYALYVLAVFLLSPNVEPGWTTLSLQLSGMLFLFSVQFMLLAENVIHMSSNSGVSHRRHLIIRELRSARSRRDGVLNVVDGGGHFQLGSPALADQEGREAQWHARP